MCLCLQHPEQHALFMTVYGGDKANSDERFKAHVDIQQHQRLARESAGNFAYARDVLIRFGCGGERVRNDEGLIWRGGETRACFKNK